MKAGCVSGHNRVLQFQRSQAVKNGTTRLQGSLGGCVGGDGAVVQRRRTADVKKAPAGNGVCGRSSCAWRGSIAADGTVFQGHRAVLVGDAAAVAWAAGAGSASAAGGTIPAHRALVQIHRSKIVRDPATPRVAAGA